MSKSRFKVQGSGYMEKIEDRPTAHEFGLGSIHVSLVP
jgi:hypothetical protein